VSPYCPPQVPSVVTGRAVEELEGLAEVSEELSDGPLVELSTPLVGLPAGVPVQGPLWHPVPQ